MTGPAHGTLSGTRAGRHLHAGGQLQRGADSFTFKANDGVLDSTAATVSITVTAVNDAPVATSQSVTTNEDTAKAIALGVTDPDNSTFTFTITTPPAHGTLSGTAPALTYTPAANYNGADSFSFKANDGTVDSNVATVSITVTAVNDAPVANDDTATTPEDTAITIAVRTNDTDADGDTLTITTVGTAAHGTAVKIGSSIRYTPAANYNGTDSFTYTISDGHGGTATATVTVTVTSVNDAPDAADDTATTAEDTPVTIDVRANDTDVDGDTLTVTAVTTPLHGTAAINGAGTVLYTPAANYAGPDNFVYTLSDGQGGTDTANVVVTVTAVNDPPVAANDSYTATEDVVLTVAAPGVLANDTDIDSASITAVLVTAPAHGTLVSVGEGG